MPPASAVGSPIIAREFAGPAFACSWEMGGFGAAWVRVTGELDLATSPDFRQTVGEAQRAVRLVVLDLRELYFIDCSGVRVILDAALDSRRSGGRLLIVRGPSQVDRVLTLTKVGRHVTIFDVAVDERAPALFQAVLPEAAA
jgi:anti-anti-sigma factor